MDPAGSVPQIDEKINRDGGRWRHGDGLLGVTAVERKGAVVVIAA